MTDVSSPHPSRPRRRNQVRHRVYTLLNDGSHAVAARLVHISLVALIVLNVVAVISESVEAWSVTHGPVFRVFDVFSVAVFSLEYLLRLWTAVELPERQFHHPIFGRLRWIVTPMAIIDLLAVLPFYLGIVVEIDLRMLRVLRILRIFKLTRYSLALSVIADVARQEARTIAAMLIVLSVMVVMAASLMYLAEHHAQPHVFRDIPTSMWWAVVTLTTLGYGDMVPVTVVGRILGGITAVFGLGMIALPSGVLASGFMEQLRLRREEYRTLVDHTLDAEGHLTRGGKRRLDDARRHLNLTEEEAIEILEAEVNGHRVCPHCGQSHGKRG